MKVIFLDNDGVICLSNNWGSRSKKAQEYRAKNGIEQRLSSSNRDLPVRAHHLRLKRASDVSVFEEVVHLSSLFKL